MANRPSRDEPASCGAEREARRATEALFRRLAVERRRLRRTARSRALLIDLAVAMATYTGVTIAVILGAVYGVGTAFGLLGG